MQITFEQKGDFQAMRTAKQWCRDNGVSFASAFGPEPLGLMRGKFIIAKWCNLNQKERQQLDGKMEGDMRKGPVTITMHD